MCWDMVAVVSPAVSPCAEPSRKLLHLRYKPPHHIEAHYMQRTHLLLSLLIATVRPGHFAEASVMCFDMVSPYSNTLCHALNLDS